MTVGFQTDSLALGEPLVLDATHDGIPDVFVTVRSIESTPSPSRTVLLRGIMQGGRPDLFAPSPLPNGFNESLSTTLLAVTNLNGDANNDFVSADGVGPDLAVQLSMPSGGFDQTYVYALTDGAVAQRLFVVDMDADGFVDVMVQAWDPVLSTVVVLTLRNGGTGFLEALPPVQLSSQADVALGDLNGDLRPDILEYSKIATTPCQVRLSTGALGFQAPVAFGPAGPLMDALVVQANPGGVPDVALLGANQSLFLCYGSGGGAMAPQYDSIPLDRPTPRFLAAADLNVDGSLDYVVSNSNGNTAGGTLEVVGLGNPTGTHTFLSAGQNPGRAVIADLDRDGNLDIVTAPAQNFAHRLSIIFGPVSTGKGLSLPIAGSNPRSPTLADLNRDGTPDIIATLDASIQLRLRDAAGNYTSGTSIANGLNPYRQVACDLNRDARPDLLFANYLTFPNYAVRLRVYTGNGTGLDATPLGPFGSASTFLPQNPVVDMNRDGIPDVVTMNGDGVGVYAGDGTGGFPLETFAFAMPAAQPEGVAAGDLDRDGDPDLAVTTNPGIALLASDGVGTLTLVGTIGASVWYRAIAVADVNRDGKADIIAHRALSSSYDRESVGVDIFYTDGAWNVVQQRSLGAPEHAGLIVDSWDVDRNGLPDIVVTGISSGPSPRQTVTAVYLQDSPDHFAPRVEYLRGDNSTVWDGAGDVDGDGQRDLFNFFSDNGSWSFTAIQGNSSVGGWGVAGQQDLAPGGNPHGLASGDMNRDGTPDLVLGDYSGAVRVFFGYGNGTFVEPSFSVSTVGLTDVALADFNRDGRLDVVGANEGGGITVLLGIGDYGALGAPNIYSCPGPIRNVRIGDFNRDGKADVAAYGWPLAAYIFLGAGNGTLTLHQSVAVPGTGYGANLAVGDFNRDGIEDLAMSLTDTDPSIFIAFGVGNGTFGTPTMKWINYAVSTPTGLTACDMNLDGKMDLILALAGSNTNPMIVLNGDGDGNFPSGTAYPSTSAESDYFATGFLNGDQWPDVVQSGLNGTSVRLGTGAGALGPRFDAGSSSSPQGVIIADLDRDGMNDIALNDAGAATTLILLNSQTSITAVEPSVASPRTARPTLSQNAPNPFNPRTTIAFTMPKAGPARLAIYDVQGRSVAKLVDRSLPAGAHHVQWDGRDASGRDAASGVYFYRLETGNRAAARRMVLMK